MRLLYSILFLLAHTAMSAAPLVITPSVSPDGSQIAFSYQGDIWITSVNDDFARRLTIHESYESHPHWSPDGTKLVFQGNRWGNNDIFVTDVSTGAIKRLTYHSANDTHPRWISDTEVSFMSRRGFQQIERESEVHQVSIAGGTPYRMIDAVVLSPAPMKNSQDIVFVRGTCRVAREAYVGPANRDIWKYSATSDQYTQLTTHEGQDILPDTEGDNIYFLSARSGRYNLTIINKEGNLQALTTYSDEGITYFDVSADESTVVFIKGGELKRASLDNLEDAEGIDIKVTADDRFDPIEHETLSRGASNYALSPSEDHVLLEVRGELFLKENDKEKDRAVQLTNHPYRDKDAVWVSESTIIFSSDRGGQFDLYKLTAKDPSTSLYKSFQFTVEQLTSHEAEEEALVVSPDRTQLAYRRGRGELVVVSLDTLGNISNERVLQDGWDIPGGIAWSPDSKWLAYALSDLNFNEEIYIHRADGSSDPVNVSLHPRTDRSPVWSPDGSKLGFISIRNNGDSDVWFVWLKKSDWEKTQRDWEEDDDEKESEMKGKDKDKDKKKDKDAVQPVEIDFDDIYERIMQVTRIAGNEGDLSISKDGETFYFSTNGGGRQGSPGDPAYMSINWDGEDAKTLFSNLDINAPRLNKKGDRIYSLKRGGTLVSINPSAKKQEGQPFKVKMDIDHQQERTQVFEEAWRRLRDGFYDPEFHGQDWNELKTVYKARCINATTDQDFHNQFNEMLGQLNASHMGIRGRGREETQSERTGLLGVDIKPVNNGVEVLSVISGTPADRSNSRLEVGDIITAVNGTLITNTTNFYSLLEDLANERVLLNVRSSTGALKEVIIRPTNSINVENYEAWVKERKRLTEEYSNGKLGYIHIRGMNWQSFERFERELTASGLGKEGIVIDVRFNGGGWTTDMLMAVLNVRQHSFTIPRGAAKSLENEKDDFRNTYPFGERLPLSSWTKPSIALCNENSYSNAEIFSHAYQSLGHGTLVGRPTFGAVISTGGAGLLNGKFVRMPFRAWYVKSTNKNMEHGPAVPDIEVFNLPDSKAKGQDPQLQRAVEQLLSEVEG